MEFMVKFAFVPFSHSWGLMVLAFFSESLPTSEIACKLKLTQNFHKIQNC